jgi:hypothetical protein
MAEQELSTEHLRELARRVSAALPPGVFYALVIWPPGQAGDCAYFSNAQKIEAREAMQTILGYGQR